MHSCLKTASFTAEKKESQIGFTSQRLKLQWLATFPCVQIHTESFDLFVS